MQLELQNNFSAQPTENILTAPSAKEINNTSLNTSIGNTINNGTPSSYTSTQSNDTSNNKKSSEKSISIGQLPKSKDQTGTYGVN